LVRPAILPEVGITVDRIEHRAAEEDFAVGKGGVAADVRSGGAIWRSGAAGPGLKREDCYLSRKVRTIQAQLIDVTGIAVVVGEINEAINRIDDGGSEAAFAGVERNVSD